MAAISVPFSTRSGWVSFPPAGSQVIRTCEKSASSGSVQVISALPSDWAETIGVTSAGGVVSCGAGASSQAKNSSADTTGITVNTPARDAFMAVRFVLSILFITYLM